jgi:hypothetical protein
MFLIQDKMKTETFLAATSIFTVGIYAASPDPLRKVGRPQRSRLGRSE